MIARHPVKLHLVGWRSVAKRALRTGYQLHTGAEFFQFIGIVSLPDILQSDVQRLIFNVYSELWRTANRIFYQKHFILHRRGNLVMLRVGYAERGRRVGIHFMAVFQLFAEQRRQFVVVAPLFQFFIQVDDHFASPGADFLRRLN